jgi:hypothetical protein
MKTHADKVGIRLKFAARIKTPSLRRLMLVKLTCHGSAVR